MSTSFAVFYYKLEVHKRRTTIVRAEILTLTMIYMLNQFDS